MPYLTASPPPALATPPNHYRIHRDDLVDLIIAMLSDSSYSGIFNATAPQPVRMSDLCASLGTVTGRPSWLPVPDFALKVRPDVTPASSARARQRTSTRIAAPAYAPLRLQSAVPVACTRDQ